MERDESAASLRELGIDGAPGALMVGGQATVVDYDAELQRHNEVLRSAYGIERHDHVIDIGCGAGQTTRDAARFASSGSVLGVDKSTAMIERARRLTAAEHLRNVTYLHADVETHEFPADRFDVAISRFGTMFFAEPVAAFVNIARSLRPGGRLVMMVWQRREDNEWSELITLALSAGGSASSAGPTSADAFSLADRAETKSILAAAGFSDVTFTDVREPVYYGPDVDSALEWVLGFSTVNDVLARADDAPQELILDRLRELLSAHASSKGVWLGSRAWIVTASRR